VSGQRVRPEEVIITLITCVVLALFLFFRTKAIYTVRKGEMKGFLIFFFLCVCVFFFK